MAAPPGEKTSPLFRSCRVLHSLHCLLHSMVQDVRKRMQQKHRITEMTGDGGQGFRSHDTELVPWHWFS